MANIVERKIVISDGPSGLDIIISGVNSSIGQYVEKHDQNRLLDMINAGGIEGLSFQGNDLSFYQTTKQIRALNIPAETKAIDKIIIQDYQTVIDNNVNNERLYSLYEKIVAKINKTPSTEKRTVRRHNVYEFKQFMAGGAIVGILLGGIVGTHALANKVTNTEPEGPYKGSDHDFYQELTPEEESMRRQILENAEVSFEEETEQHSRTM